MQPILIKTARAMFRADPDGKICEYDILPAHDKRRYESMAAAALSVVLLQPLPEAVAANLSL